MDAIGDLRDSELQVGEEFEIGDSTHLILEGLFPGHQPMVKRVNDCNNQRENPNHNIQNDVKVGGKRELFRQVCVGQCLKLELQIILDLSHPVPLIISKFPRRAEVQVHCDQGLLSSVFLEVVQP